MVQGRVTINDLANELGVSKSTISRALNNQGRISEKTRKEVADLAKKWGYKPNPFAINLLKKKSKIIGLILPEFTHHYFAKVLKGVNQIVNQHGYQLFISVHEGKYEDEVKAVNMLNNMRVDGIIASYAKETSNFDHFLDAMEDDVPIVFVDRMCEDLDSSYVITDDFPGCELAIEQLARSGARNIAHIAGPENLSTSFNRMMGYREGLKTNGLDFDPQLLIQSDDLDWRRQVQDLSMSDKIDGILAFNDYLAFEAIEVLRMSGKQVPQDVAVIGFADEPVARYMSPRLTTVHQPAEEMGKRAAEILFDHIKTEDIFSHVCESLPTNLIIRGTTRNTDGATARSISEIVEVG
ncbi:MAG: LacI family DNA-binding transcriptional regulator [Cyclobacteriaceae bacterium]